MQRAPALQAALEEKEAEIKAMVIKQEKDVAQLYTLSKHMDKIRNVRSAGVKGRHVVARAVQGSRCAVAHASRRCARSSTSRSTFSSSFNLGAWRS